MSDYTVLGALSATLKELLKQNITLSPDPALSGVEIHLLSPKEMQEAGHATGISLWLYKVSRMAEMVNEPPERISANQIARTPLPILLFYLVTPFAPHPETRHVLLGRVLQVMNDHAILRGADLTGSLKGTTDQYRLNLETLSLEELSLVWEALSEPYQLSVTYMVQVARIDSDAEPIKSMPVVMRQATYAQILSGG
jgi:hypothetical protein